jgi:hypothetical protein
MTHLTPAELERLAAPPYRLHRNECRPLMLEEVGGAPNRVAYRVPA